MKRLGGLLTDRSRDGASFKRTRYFPGESTSLFYSENCVISSFQRVHGVSWIATKKFRRRHLRLRRYSRGLRRIGLEGLIVPLARILPQPLLGTRLCAIKSVIY